MSGERVDVGIVTWNTKDLTVEAIARLLAVAAQDDVEVRILVRDNASSDGTAAAIRSAAPVADVDEGDVNLGFAAGVNTLLRRSDAPWFLMLNSDAWPEAGAIRALLDCAQRRPRAAAVAPVLRRPDGTPEQSTYPIPSLPVAVRSAVSPGRYLLDSPEERQVGWAVGAALLLRRDAIDALGLFDESLFMYAEDLDWCWRAGTAGWSTWLNPAAVFCHIGNASGEQRYGDRRSAAWINNTIRVFGQRHARPKTLAWQLANAGGAWAAGRRAGRSGNVDGRTFWRAQIRPWLSRPHPDVAAPR